MKKVTSLKCSLAATCLSCAGVMGHGQEVVHALTGTVTSINIQNHTIAVKTYDDSEGLFRVQMKSDVPMDFSSKVRAETTPAEDFSKQGANVLVYYIGDAAQRTVVALQDLGAGPIGLNKGTLVKLDKHKHMLTIKDDAGGGNDTFGMDDKTVSEGTDGVAPGDKFGAAKGDHVWVISRADGAKKTVLFLRAK